MTIPKKDASQQVYQARINRVIDYISENLAEELSLKRLAEVANFSEFHFHRVFRALLNEPLNEFITRLRLEKAIRMLRQNPRCDLTKIAVECGFHSLSNFSRTFIAASAPAKLNSSLSSKRARSVKPSPSNHGHRSKITASSGFAQIAISAQKVSDLHKKSDV